MFWSALLLIHGVVAAALLGMVTHQSLSVVVRGSKASFAGSYVAVRSALFTDAIVVTFALNFVLGALIYTRYRYTARPVMEDLGLQPYVGAFEFKEHLLAIALFTLPAYWTFWRRIPPELGIRTRATLTLFVGGSVWGAYLIGHLVNNVRGGMMAPVDRPLLAARVLPAFSIAAATTYFLVMGFGATTFIYYPQIGAWSLARQEGVGPPMFFYGWLAEAIFAGLVAAGLAALAPRPASAALFRAYPFVSAATPIVLTLWVLYLLRGYFGVGR